MKKKRVLLVNEASTFKSGLGKYGFNLLTKLQERGYKVAELAFGKYVNATDDGEITWPVYYNNIPESDHRWREFSSDPENAWGKWRLSKVCLHFLPDYILNFTDPWHSKFIVINPCTKYVNYICMPTADTFPIKPKYHPNYTAPDSILTYSDWAASNLNRVFPHMNAKCARYGVDPSVYYPLKNRDLVKQNMGINPDSIIIGMVGKNQPRKLFAELLITFRHLLTKHQNILLYIHTTHPERMAWDFENLLDITGTANHVLFTYTCKKCGNLYPSLFKGEVTHCKVCNDFGCTIKSPSFDVSESVMNKLFNLMDIYVQFATSEGAGMPIAEAAYCGLPVFAVDTTAMRDYPHTIGSYPLPCYEFWTHNEHGFRGWPNRENAALMISAMIDKGLPFIREEGERMRQRALEIYNWDKVCDVWQQAIEDLPPKNLWNAPSDYLEPIEDTKELSLFGIFNILQDYLKINDPYGLIQLCRRAQNKPAQIYNHFVATDSREELISHMNNYVQQYNIFEDVRVGKRQLMTEDFIDYASIKEIVHG